MYIEIPIPDAGVAIIIALLILLFIGKWLLSFITG